MSFSFKDFIIYAHFHLNRTLIANTLCVNPNSKCKGKCYLNKSLKRSQEQEQKVPNFSKDNKTIVFILETSGHHEILEDQESGYFKA